MVRKSVESGVGRLRESMSSTLSGEGVTRADGRDMGPSKGSIVVDDSVDRSTWVMVA